ncbi:MAG: DUF1573 domain-containing protein [Phycisphaerales bacterium]|nr:DUF1573 domain-containing protein [Phycisphaerales bacterium]
MSTIGCLAASALGALSLAWVATAQVIADPPVIPLGFIEPRATITRSFRLVNTGAQTVTIASAIPSCTCTSVDAQGKVIQPGAALELPMTMKVSAATGIKVAGITFTFGPGIPPVTVEMKGEIAYPVRATAIDFMSGATVPYINAFGDPALPQGSASAPLDGIVTVASIDSTVFRVTSVMGAPAQFVGFVPSSDAPRPSYQVKYSLAGIPCDRVPPYLVIATDHPKAPIIDLRIRHKCTKISPQLPFAEYRANLGALEPGVRTAFEFELKKSQGWRVTGVASRDPRVLVEFMAQQSDTDHAMISLAATAAPNATGIILAPVSMTATDPAGATKSSDFWIYFDAAPRVVASTPVQNSGK